MIRIRNTANDGFGFGSSMNESADKLKIDFYDSCTVVRNANDGFVSGMNESADKFKQCCGCGSVSF